MLFPFPEFEIRILAHAFSNSKILKTPEGNLPTWMEVSVCLSDVWLMCTSIAWHVECWAGPERLGLMPSMTLPLLSVSRSQTCFWTSVSSSLKLVIGLSLLNVLTSLVCHNSLSLFNFFQMHHIYILHRNTNSQTL